jgi:glutaconate CoA-transferase subunit B
MTAPDHMLSELLIVACSEVFRNNGEIVATGIGPIPRVAAGLAKTTHSPELLMTDGEAYLVEEPVPIGPRGYDDRKPSGYLPFSRYFDSAVWTGRRHALVSPIQIDRFGQMNLSYVGGTFDKPKVQMLGARGFPGNTIHHINSMFVPAHSTRIFVPGVDLRFIVTDLCVMDFGGPDHAIRLVSLHDGVTLDQVREATGFDLLVDGTPPVTPAPTEEQLAIIARLDPHNIRATVLKGNPPGKRS